MIRKVSAEDIAIRGNGTGLEYMCPTRHFVYIFFNPVFQVSTAKNEINLFNNQALIVAPVTFAPAGAMTPSAEFLYSKDRTDSRMGTYVAMHFVAKIIKWLLILSAYYCPSLCVYKLHLATLGMDYLSIAIILLCG